MTPAGFPHSDIPGSKPVCGSPRLIAAYHVLHRLLVPRHPPCALSSLTGISLRCFTVHYPASRIRLSKSVRDAHGVASDRDRDSHRVRSARAISLYGRRERRSGPSLASGGDSGARTRSLRLAKPALSQLSYIPGSGVRGGSPRAGSVGGPGWTRTTHLTLIRRAL